MLEPVRRETGKLSGRRPCICDLDAVRAGHIDPGRASADTIIPVEQSRAPAAPDAVAIEVQAEGVMDGIRFGEVE